MDRITKQSLNKEIELLQKHCPHNEIQELPYMWAPGHFVGTVHVCKNYEKIMGVGDGINTEGEYEPKKPTR